MKEKKNLVTDVINNSVNILTMSVLDYSIRIIFFRLILTEFKKQEHTHYSVIIYHLCVYYCVGKNSIIYRNIY